ncbi:MAG: hypothetical protein J5594_00945 [Elusimicrobiaceae bacterium]|nr:hypothetical protein [Elusimicrobiaceae bacterium]
MPIFNDLDLKKWKELDDIETDSLWLFDKRDNTGKHNGFYHGNFIPQVPRQLIKRYTKKGDYVLDPFLGSGTTAIECENLQRGCVGIELNPELVTYVKNKTLSSKNIHCFCGDSTDLKVFQKIRDLLPQKQVGLVILHPPYFDIVKFSNKKTDLSNQKTYQEFFKLFCKVIDNSLTLLQPKRYLAIVIGDKYTKGEWIPLGFYSILAAQGKKLKLKSIVVKNMEGNRGKRAQHTIWRYRALSSDYYIFKHEYILIFQKDK